MFTEPKIVSTNDLASRSYISYYFDGKRYREYNAKKLGKDINPNYAQTLRDRDRLLIKLQFEFKISLLSGWSPLQISINRNVTLKDGMAEVLKIKIASDYSATYLRDLITIHKQFLTFTSANILNQYVCNIQITHIEAFLSQFKTSNRHYMNKRRMLSVFFSEMLRKGYVNNNIVMQTTRQKTKSILHEIYSKDELNRVLQYLKVDFPNLHLCCLLTYGCLLRPHQEVRSLKRSDINHDYSQIQLSGYKNKSGRIRTVFVPSYISAILKERLDSVADSNSNIFTLQHESTFNDDYFKTQWSRAKSLMIKAGIIRKEQTLYSFRHTAAVNVYKKTKDLHILQQLLQHSNMIVTLNYLRGLGEVTDDRLKDVLPEL